MVKKSKESPELVAIREWASKMSYPELQSTLATIQETAAASTTSFIDAWDEGPGEVDLPVPTAPAPLLRIRLDLDSAKPAIWRRLEVRGDITVDMLHEVLQAAMGWTDSHLHRFWVGPEKKIWNGPYLLTEFDVGEGEEGTLEVDVEVSQLLRTKGDRLFYTYDFGDGWNHTLKLEAVVDCSDDHPPAVCTGGRNACPPEDVGGPGSHNELVAAYQEAPDLSTMDDQYAEWLPPEWNPLAFDPEDANLALSMVGADPEDLIALLAPKGLPEVHPTLASVLGRMPILAAAAPVKAISAAAVNYPALGSETPPLPEARIEHAVYPWQLLLTKAGTDGIPMTSAGWMKPDVVSVLWRELNIEAEWWGKGNREENTMPIHQLRLSAQRAGLLRKHKGRLVRTPSGREVTDNPIALWRRLAATVIAGDEYFANDVEALTLLHLAIGAAVNFDILDAVTEDLYLAGWPVPVGHYDQATLHVCRDVLTLVARLCGGSLVRNKPGTDVSQAFALQALYDGAAR